MAIRGLPPFLLPAAPLVARNLTKAYARGVARSPHRISAIDSVDLDAYPGELIALSGPAGAGKTTLLQCLAGLLKPDCGKVELFGEAFPSGWTPPGLAYVPAAPAFYPFLTPLDVVRMAMARDTNPATNRTAEELLESLDLDRLREARVSALPRDILRRLAVAHALATRPAVILVDSSSSFLASPFDAVTLSVLGSFACEGAAVILAARDVSAIAIAATRILIMKNGRTGRTFSVESFGEPIVAGLPATASRIVAERIH
jgi:ABC-type multidrug transport system ATPase subunit